jgi:hypothetical protein
VFERVNVFVEPSEDEASVVRHFTETALLDGQERSTVGGVQTLRVTRRAETWSIAQEMIVVERDDAHLPIERPDP